MFVVASADTTNTCHSEAVRTFVTGYFVGSTTGRGEGFLSCCTVPQNQGTLGSDPHPSESCFQRGVVREMRSRYLESSLTKALTYVRSSRAFASKIKRRGEGAVGVETHHHQLFVYEKGWLAGVRVSQ